MATAIVTVLPVAIVWTLRQNGLVGAPLGIVTAVAISLAVGRVGEAIWSRRRHPADTLFSELLLWGWIRRLRDDRLLARADRLLADLTAPGGDQPARRRERVLRQLATAIDAQDAYLDGHSRRVARHATMIARKLGLPRSEVTRVLAAAAVHDVGKLNVPLEVLNKPGPLTEEEFALIRRHPEDGEHFVEALGDPALSSIVRHHHERVDGHGYPDGMAGEQIPLGARIVAVADTFDAITSERAYRSAGSDREALRILREASGTQLDPDAVGAFVAHYSGRGRLALGTLVAGLLAPQPRHAGHGATTGSVASGKLVALATVSAAIGIGGVAVTGVSNSPARAISRSALPSAGAALGANPITGGSVVTGASAASGSRHHPASMRRASAARPHASQSARNGRRTTARSGALRRGGSATGGSGRTPANSAPNGRTGASSPTGAPNSGGAGAPTSPASAPTAAAGSPTAASGSGASGAVTGVPNPAGVTGVVSGTVGKGSNGRGPGGAGPPGLTGLNPGLGQAPPPGQQKRGS